MSRRNPFDALTRPDLPVSRRTFMVLAAGVLVFDQLTKWLAVHFLLPLTRHPAFAQQRVDVIPNYFALWYRENTGAAFSLFEEHTGLLALVSAVICVGFVLWAWRLRPAERGLRVAFGLIVGGAIGNLIDRVRLNYVIDFLHAHWQWKYQWPTFNVADSAVCIGMALLFVASLRLPRQADAAVVEPSAGTDTARSAARGTEKPKKPRHGSPVDPAA
jgi:signal peptidase II